MSKTHLQHLQHAHNWHPLADVAAWVVEQAKAIQQIAAPTFHERPRADYVMQAFAALGLADVRQDALHNVYGTLPGQHPSAPGLMLCAHTDTVFGPATDLALRQQNGTVYGPGLGDNSVGVAGLLGLVAALARIGARPACNLYMVATTREEGLGDLGGMRAAYDALKPHVAAVINIEGLAYGYVYHAGIAVRRLHIVARTPGGHSWLHFGRPSATHAIVQLGAALTHLPTSETPRTTFNIGMLDGGQSINAIASEASLWLDLRSEDHTALAALEQQVRAQVAQLSADDLTFTIEVVGDRAGGSLAPSHPLVQDALGTLALLGTRATLQSGSTDGNVPLAHGTPTVTVGITRGGNAHRLDEFIETGPVRDGLHQLVLLTLATAERVAQR